MKHYTGLNETYGEDTLYDLNPVRAVNTHLVDEDDRKYLDLKSGHYTTLGYTSYIYMMASRQFEKIMEHMTPYLDSRDVQQDIYEELAQKVLSLTDDGFQRVLFTNSDAENTDLALTLANLTHKKGNSSRILAFRDSEHEDFFVGFDYEKASTFYPQYGQVSLIDYPKTPEQEEQVLASISQVAASYDVMLIEPVLVSAGLYATSDDFFNSLLKILKDNQVLTVFDEGATGFFKTGPAFYYQKLDEKPDMLCLGRAINNGISPFACVCVTAEFDQKLEGKELGKKNFSPQNGNLLGFASAQAVLDFYLDCPPIFGEKAQRVSKLVSDCLDEAQLSYRNLGLMTAIPTAKGQARAMVKTLEQEGILVGFYENQDEEGLLIIAQYTILFEPLEEGVRTIASKLKESN